MLFELTPLEILLLLVAAAGIGISKSGFAGVSMIHVIIFAQIFETKTSTGVLLPMLVIGDLLAIWFFGKKVDWSHVRKLLPPAMIGVVFGWLLMDRMPESVFRPTVGLIILVLTLIQVLRIWRPKLFDSIPHQKWFAWMLGLLAGMTTMMANAAGPVVALYLLAVSLPKLELVASSAWFFLVINVFKLPFSFSMGFISTDSLIIDLAFAPGILLGMVLGSWLVNRIPQKLFDSFLLAFTAFVALRMVASG